MADLEKVVFLAAARLGKNAYGMTIRREIEIRTGEDKSLGSIYAALDRLESKGFVTSIEGGELDSSFSGFGRRYFTPTAAGYEALQRAMAAFDQMLDGLDLERAE